MTERGIRGGIYHSVTRYTKPNNEYMKTYTKNDELSYLKYWNVNNLHTWAMSKNLLVNYFKWVEDVSEFVKYFIKSYYDESDELYFLKVGVQYLEKITWSLQWFIIFTRKKENWKGRNACS